MKLFTFIVLTLVHVPTFCLASYNVWLDNSLTKYRQDGEDGTNGSTSLSVGMAKNEISSFQIMIYADGESLSNVDVTVSDLSLQSGDDTIDDIYIYKQFYVQAVNQSRVDYPTGWYPDALLPKVDRYFKETRNAFPFDVAENKVQGVWVDVGTTVSTPAGEYTGIVTVSSAGKPDISLPITVTVWDFSLPSTSLFHTQFVFRQSYMTYGHGIGMEPAWNGAPEAVDMTKTYMKMFLYHKMSAVVAGGRSMIGESYMPWDDETKTLSVVNWEPWYAIVNDVFSGTAITSGPLSGAKMSMKRVPAEFPADHDSRTDITANDKEIAARQYAQIVWDKFMAEGWDPWNTLIFGTADEPRCDQTMTWRGETMNKCNVVIDQAQDINAINTGGLGIFKRIYTNSKMRANLEQFGEYGFYSANTYTFVCPGWDKECVVGGTKVSRDSYPGYPNDELWGYLACDNNGCWITGDSKFAGQIDWSVDAKALYNRLPGFIWGKYELTGTVYWGTVSDNYSGGGDPFHSTWHFGSNGDGHLVYPGVPTSSGRVPGAHTPIIGGVHDIPIESIRLKHIRDAIQDWEYVQLAKEATTTSQTFAILDQVFTRPDIEHAYWNLSTDPDNFVATRQALANLIQGHGLPTCTITLPTSDATYENGAQAGITLSGIATDDVGITQVAWENLSTGESGNAEGTQSWTVADIALIEGDNLIVVTVSDTDNNTGEDQITVRYTPDGSANTGRGDDSGSGSGCFIEIFFR